MLRKEIVAMFMESPFYFDLLLQERLKLIQKHENILCPKTNKKTKYVLKRINHEFTYNKWDH
jgi:hypothetical protein